MVDKKFRMIFNKQICTKGCENKYLLMFKKFLLGMEVLILNNLLK